MKKLLLLMIALLTGVSGVWALTQVTSITSGKTYYFYNSRFGQYINTSLKTDNNIFNAIKFTLTGSDGNYNIYSADKSGYLTWGTLTNGTAPTISAATSENTLWTIDVQSGNIMNIYPKGQTSKELISQSTTAGKAIALWDFNNQGGQWYIYEADDIEEEYATADLSRAVDAITSGNVYRIFTEFGNSNTKYYLTADGTLTTSEEDAYYFTFTATTGTNYAPAGKAWKISSTTGKYFTNGSQTNGIPAFLGSISTTTTNSRDTYEGQVLFLNASGKYAIRSTNNSTNNGYAENSYWMVDDTDSDGVPEAGYCTTLDEKHYDWQLEEPSGYVTYNLYFNGAKLATDTEVPKVLGAASASLPEGWDCAYCSLSYSPSTVGALTESVDVTLTWDGPFDFSSGFDGATWYYLSLRNKGKYVQMSTTTPYPDPTTKPTVSEGLWAFTGDPYNGIKVMNARAGDGKYLKKVSADNGSAVTIQDGGQYWAIGVGTDGFYLKEPGNNNLYIHDLGSYLKIWNSSSGKNDNGSGFQVEEAEPVKVTYKLTYNGNVVSSYTKDLYELVGATAAAPSDWVLPAYCSFGSCSPATIAAETTEVTIPLNWNGPFDISSDYASATWYYMNIGGYWAANAETSDDKCSGFSDSNMKKGDRGLWAFIGNPIDGIECYNKEAGSTKKLNIDSNSKMVGSGYTLGKITRVDDKTFRLSNDGYYLSLVSGCVLGILSSEASGNAITVRSYYCQQLIDDIYYWADNNHRDEYFGPTETSLTTLTNNIATYFPKMSQATYEGYTLPNDILNDIVPKYPSTGYYRIKNNATGSYIAYGKPAAPYVDKTAGLIAISSANAATDASSIIKLTGSGGTYKLSTEGLNVQSQTTGSQAFPATSSEGVDFVFTSANKNGIVSITNSASASQENANLDGSLHHATGWIVDGVVNWNATADNSQWEIEEATSVTIPLNGPIGGNYYATMCLPFTVTLTGANAYTLTKDGTTLTPSDAMTEVDAGTPVLLIGNGTSATASIASDAEYASSPSASDLTGTFLAISGFDGATNYVLGTDGTKVGFFHWDGTTLAANRAYIAAGGGEVKGFYLNWDNATGIGEVLPEASQGKVYDLSGRMVDNRQNALPKGLYIINGRKVVVR